MNLWTVHQIGKMSQNIDIVLRKKFRFIFAKIMPEVQLQLQIICTWYQKFAICILLVGIKTQNNGVHMFYQILVF